MKRILLAVSATLALSLGLSVPASASNSHSSCSGLVASGVAGEPGARAAIQRGIFEGAVDGGVTPGAIVSEFSQDHLQSAEVCVG
jgi:hypothetical protein